MQQKALASAHYPIAFAVGFWTIGAAIPGLFILLRSLSQIERTEEDLLRFVESSKDRESLLKDITPEKPTENDETLANFGKTLE